MRNDYFEGHYKKADYVSNNAKLLDLEEVKGNFLDQMKREDPGRNEKYPMNGKTDVALILKKSK